MFAVCGRYYLGDEIPVEELQKIIDGVNRKINDSVEQTQLVVKSHGEIFPTNTVPVLSASGSQAMKWGFTRYDGKGHVINSRSETLFEKPMFRKAALEARCLIPVTYYYEWETRGNEKIKYRLRTSGPSLMYIAGIYRNEKAEPLPAFTIITRAAAQDIAFIHDRMPVILSATAQKEWLAPDAQVTDVLEDAMLGVGYQPDAPVQQSIFS